MKEHEVDHINKVGKQMRKTPIKTAPAPRQRVKRTECHLINDPHVLTFTGKHFDAKWDGEFVLYKGKHLEISYRTKRFGSYTSNIKFKVNLYGQIIDSVAFDIHNLLIDGRSHTLRDGKKELSLGGSITCAGSKVTISTNDGEEVDFISGGSYFNSYVRSDVPHVEGLCTGQRVNSKEFAHPQKQVQGKEFDVKSCVKKELFEHQCSKKRFESPIFKKLCIWFMLWNFFKIWDKNCKTNDKTTKKKVLHRQEVRRNIFIKEKKKNEERRKEERKRYEEKKKE